MVERLPKAIVEQAGEIIARYLTAASAESWGYGTDSYYDEQSMFHPMAGALLLRAHLSMYGVTGDEKYMDWARDVLGRLLDVSSQFDGGCWGLGFPWRGYPARHCYAITTAMVGDALCDAQLVIPDPTIRRSVVSAASWLVEALPWARWRTGSCPWFACGFPVLANNVAAKVGLFLLRAGVVTSNKAFTRMGQQGLSFVLANQEADGFWSYAVPSRGIDVAAKTEDSLHTAYIVESLVRAGSLTPRFSWNRRRLSHAAARGLGFFREFLLGDGRI